MKADVFLIRKQKRKWTLQSLEDIEAIANFITRDSGYYARMFTKKVFEAVDRLELFPESGRVVPELNRKEIREVIIGNYRIIYRIRGELVEILTVYHSSRLLDVNGIKNLLYKSFQWTAKNAATEFYRWP